MEITAAFLEPYFHRGKKHAGYADAKKLYDELRLHANGECPTALIHERRPSESDRILEYRKKIYIPVTKETMTNVITSLSKIRRSADWSVKYDEENQSKKIADEETLEQYTSKSFPFYKSFEAWVFSVLLKSYLIDANGVVLVVPLKTEVEASEYLKPYPVIYHADQVIEYIPEQLTIIHIEKDHRYIVVTDEVIQTWQKNKADNKYTLADEYVHELGVMPVIKMGGMFYKAEGETVIHESRIQSMVPRLNEAAREYSDLQAEVVQHIHSEKWVYATQACPDCSIEGVSSGKLIDRKTKKNVICTTCNGTGTVATSPYTQIVVRPQDKRFGESEIPTPPAGYIQKQVEIVKIQDERIDKHTLKALSAINMQFLMETPLSQSGDAKEVDRDELNNFVYSVAEDIVSLMDGIYALFAEYRYRIIVPDANERKLLLPDVAVPEKFDLLSSMYLADEIGKATTAKVSGVIVTALQIEYASKKFYNNPEIRDEVTAVLKLDPLPGLSEDEKNSRKMNGGITDEDYVISCNIVPFVRRAVFEDKDFYAKPLDEQLEVLSGYAAEVVEAASGKPDPIADEPNPANEENPE